MVTALFPIALVTSESEPMCLVLSKIFIWYLKIDSQFLMFVSNPKKHYDDTRNVSHSSYNSWLKCV